MLKINICLVFSSRKLNTEISNRGVRPKDLRPKEDRWNADASWEQVLELDHFNTT